ncbi:hypothetical protein O6H91_Y051500 [Diphasiastrum complanatum]|nr:hypothetical protein O6H91_Y051500 [Diphasiastrum complanatum]
MCITLASQFNGFRIRNMFTPRTGTVLLCFRLLQGLKTNTCEIANAHKKSLKYLHCRSSSRSITASKVLDFSKQNLSSWNSYGKCSECYSRIGFCFTFNPQNWSSNQLFWRCWPIQSGLFVRTFSSQLSSREWIEELQAERASNCENRVLLTSMTLGRTTALISSQNSSLSPDSLQGRLEYSKRGTSVLPVIFNWLDEGNNFCRGTLASAIDRLIEVARYRDALEVSEWMIGVEPNKVELMDYLTCLGLIAKVRGHSKAAKFFAYLPRDYGRTELAYLTMFANYVDQKALYRAKNLMKKMKEMGFIKSAFVYNQILTLYKDKGKEDRIPDLLKDMKAAGISPDVNTYNIMLEVKSKNGDFPGVKRLFERMKASEQVKPNVTTLSILALACISAGLIDKANAITTEIQNQEAFDKLGASHDLLITLYAKLGNTKGLAKIWHLLQESSNVSKSTYVCAIQAFGKLGEIEKAEKGFKKMQEMGPLKADQYNSLLSVYVNKGMLQRAEELFHSMLKIGCQPNGRSYHNLVLGYLKQNQTEKALQVLRDFQENIAYAGTFSCYETMVLILQALAKNGDVRNAENVFQDIKREKRSIDVFLYNTLLKAYVHAGMHAYRFLQRMAADKVSPSEETSLLLDKLKKNSGP